MEDYLYKTLVHFCWRMGSKPDINIINTIYIYFLAWNYFLCGRTLSQKKLPIIPLKSYKSSVYRGNKIGCHVVIFAVQDIYLYKVVIYPNFYLIPKTFNSIQSTRSQNQLRQKPSWYNEVK